ncbi:hypothetical protein BDV38DRAFT_190117 [Aspergillus pseudotamarii]|uniref:Uncharacterized protein n=1 Tax=Aspergillus pseudotamarii TaxID=132259 RepID=A0A5N6T5Z2_ASPPS|nr:uncharacterized protein BDV38DRAFT_190117 [Aspergillus pseudotamarii]KAE8141601.1 hypothetical protein BDV38DRAFT_190117 [Aspergillus pseudotamarii]
MPSELVVLPPSSPLMISAIPPPRPVSVNSLARASISSSIPYAKSTRSTSAEFQLPDGPIAPPVVPGQLACQSPVDTEMEDVEISVDASRPLRPELQFPNLPVEIHEAILDYLFGERAAAFTTTGPGKSPGRSWNKSLRHPRRKVLSNLALISPVWRSLVQDRIYRHIKIKGTTEELTESARWFRAHPHLASYVRHVEIWIPVWGKRAIKNNSSQIPARRYNDEDVDGSAAHTTMVWDDSDTNHGNDYKYHYASHNATLEEIFYHVQSCFPEARILTLEGGHCKKPPMVRHFRNDPCGFSGQRLPTLPEIRSFVMRGAWNIMRDHRHWRNLSEALPGLQEWHCAYAKPKVEGYHTIAEVLRRLSPSIVHLNISLEGFYSKDSTQTSWLGDGVNPPHLCRLLGDVIPHLESLAFTGKVCACLFQPTRNSLVAWPPKSSKLRSLDLVVKNCCRDKRTHSGLPFLDDFSRITNLHFIRAFERLITGAVHSLNTHQVLNYMRIRFIDLDSACPPLNPYFQLIDDECSGLWSERILDMLHEARPQAHFIELSEGIYPQYGPNHQIVGAVYPRTRPLSIHAATYKIIADVSKS